MVSSQLYSPPERRRRGPVGRRSPHSTPSASSPSTPRSAASASESWSDSPSGTGGPTSGPSRRRAMAAMTSVTGGSTSRDARTTHTTHEYDTRTHARTHDTRTRQTRQIQCWQALVILTNVIILTNTRPTITANFQVSQLSPSNKQSILIIFYQIIISEYFHVKSVILAASYPQLLFPHVYVASSSTVGDSLSTELLGCQTCINPPQITRRSAECKTTQLTGRQWW